jgi:hypothetical protein
VELVGIERFIWAVNEFNVDSYFDGKNVSPNIISNKIEEMFVE